MTEPLVSVNMITYNHAPYIAQAIEGVLRQKTNFPIELVIGEDCSTDGTREIVSEYQKKYPDIIRVVTSDKNVGMRKNAHRTMQASSGKYIAFCEGDDYWHRPDKLQKQLDYMESHPECGMVFADCDVYYNNSGELQRSVRYSDGYQAPLKLSIEQILGDEKIRTWPWTCTAMIRRDLGEQVIESDPHLHQSERFLLGDVQLFAELATISEVLYIPESLATYRNLDESASNSMDSRKRLLFSISVSELKLYLCNKYSLRENIRKKSEAVWYEKSLCLAFHDRNAKLAREIKVKKQKLTWKEWVRYLGAKHSTINYGYRAAILLRNRIKSSLN